MTEVLAFGNRRDNAQLMMDCAQLGYLPEPVLDMTFGKGRFWTSYEPEDIITNDLDHRTQADCNFDFTCLPSYWVRRYESVVFDPPYKLNGTGGGVSSDEGYGVADNMTVSERMQLCRVGLVEGIRVSRRFVLMKCQDQVVSGHKRWQTREFASLAEEYRMQLIDMLHVQSYRAQPAGRRQLHSRGDYSTLLVFEKRKK